MGLEVLEPVRTDHGSDADRPWVCRVLDDNHNTFEGVAFALSSVLPSTSYDQGMALAIRIDREGSAVVWSGHRELAELYWGQLKAFGLTMGPLEQAR
jgi:ATP-dependent Clp protease adaptor protein ClpS